MSWLYSFQGPADVPTGDTEMGDDEPGHVVFRERPNTGKVDLYILRTRNDVFRTALYDWHGHGEPEEMVALVAEALKGVSGEQ